MSTRTLLSRFNSLARANTLTFLSFSGFSFVCGFDKRNSSGGAPSSPRTWPQASFVGVLDRPAMPQQYILIPRLSMKRGAGETVPGTPIPRLYLFLVLSPWRSFRNALLSFHTGRISRCLMFMRHQIGRRVHIVLYRDGFFALYRDGFFAHTLGG
jgi:hypothetical protein